MKKMKLGICNMNPEEHPERFVASCDLRYSVE